MGSLSSAIALDSSALVAIHLQESGYEQVAREMQSRDTMLIGTPTVLETVMVLSKRLKQDARPILYAFFRHANIKVIAFNEQHLDSAVNAFLRFGRGRHRASLNFGDCQAYAIASVADIPLLFVGEDFIHTDLKAA